MYRIAILGCENSHADAFIGIIKEGKYPDVEVVGVYSDDPDAVQRMKEKFGVYCAESYDEFVGKVDGIMVTARHGDNHYKYAEPYLTSGIPMFIDKPITASKEDAVRLAKALKKHGIRYTGGSSCIHCDEVKELSAFFGSGELGRVVGGVVRAPISLENAYGNMWFYSQHLVQIMQKIFGTYPVSVSAKKQGVQINAVFSYGEFDVNAIYTNDSYLYFGSVQMEKATKSLDIVVNERLYAPEFDAFYKLLSGGESFERLDDFISPVFIIDAFIRAVETGELVQIDKVPAEEEL